MMRRTPHIKCTKVMSIALVVVLMLLLVGCGGAPSDPAPKDTTTAMGGLPVAESAVSELAEDAKLLLVKTGAVVGPESKPAWVYVFGSPESGKMYSVSLTNGNVMDASEIGDAPLGEGEWDEVPSTEAWKIDSTEAYEKALATSDAGDADVSYEMLLETYVPQSAGNVPTEPFVWYVSMTWGETGAVIAVNAETGVAEKKQ